MISPLAGKTLPPASLVWIPGLISAYYTGQPDPGVAAQRVSFGTSGHRGSSLTNSFNEAHILAITQAICDHRAKAGINGPLFIGIDTHALSTPALASALEVLIANGVEVMAAPAGILTPTPSVSLAILTYNKGRTGGLADGIVITPSHNPPQDGGFKYNPPNGGPADTDVTAGIERAANDFLRAQLAGVRRVPYERALRSPHFHSFDFITPYVADLANVVDMAAIQRAGVKIGIDPLGGAGVQYWAPIIERYGLNATVVNARIDPTFGFMPADWDGQIRMDCSSPYAMAGLIALRDDFDVAWGNDTDADRHGIVCRSAGLMNPNHFLSAAIAYLFTHRPGWPAGAAVGKTVVSSAMIDRVTAKLGRQLVEVPVGFKWFSAGLMEGSLGFGGEESAGAAFLRRDGGVWTTDKDGLIMGLLAAEMMAVTGEDPGRAYDKLTETEGKSWYARIDAPASPAQKQILKALRPEQVKLADLGGEKIEAVLTNAPGNKAAIGGLKISAADGWFAVRPSGTEDVSKIYAESFKSADHLARIQGEAGELLKSVYAG